ncbi:MAG TPA: hypothetical protein VF364_13075 [Candidatus Limnocylindria bacterium]
MTVNDNPASVECPGWARGFPICEATIDFEARGYAAFLGWVQLVRMGTSAEAGDHTWVTDPLELYEGLETPFGFYGLAPTLFDAPSRSDRSRDLDWYAESFLCVAPTAPMARDVEPVAGFSWGFLLANGELSIRTPERRSLATWSQHVPLLEARCPTWTFLGPSSA